MGEHKSMGGDCMCWIRKRWHRVRFGILLIVIGVLWLGQRAGWVPLEIFGPLVLLTLGVWMIVTSFLQKRQAPSQSTTSNEGVANRNEE
jgi:putative Mn2+ efflux pump MntP